MNTFFGFLLLLVSSWSSVMGEVRLSGSFSCQQCKFDGMRPSKIIGIPQEVPNVPAGYDHFPGVGYYKFYSNGAMSFSKAKEICEDDGAHLAIINSRAEEEVLKKIFAKHPSDKNAAYLGFSDMREEGKYITIFGQPLQNTGFSTWMTGQPDNLEGNEDCGSLYRYGGLNDLWCDKHGPWPFFCEH